MLHRHYIKRPFLFTSVIYDAHFSFGINFKPFFFPAVKFRQVYNYKMPHVMANIYVHAYKFSDISILNKNVSIFHQ